MDDDFCLVPIIVPRANFDAEALLVSKIANDVIFLAEGLTFKKVILHM